MMTRKVQIQKSKRYFKGKFTPGMIGVRRGVEPELEEEGEEEELEEEEKGEEMLWILSSECKVRRWRQDLRE
jgi:hypothetical protein